MTAEALWEQCLEEPVFRATSRAMLVNGFATRHAERFVGEVEGAFLNKVTPGLGPAALNLNLHAIWMQELIDIFRRAIELQYRAQTGDLLNEYYVSIPDEPSLQSLGGTISRNRAVCVKYPTYLRYEADADGMAVSRPYTKGADFWTVNLAGWKA